MDLHTIAELVRGAGPGLRLRQGMVTDIAADGSLTCSIGGSGVAVAGIRAFASVCPKLYSGVWLATDGVDVFAIGTIAPVGPAYCAVLRPSSQTLATASDTAINFTASATVQADTHGMFATGSPSQLTVQVPGVYLLSASVSFDANSAGLRSIWVKGAGNTVARIAMNATSSGTAILSVSGEVELAVGDAIELYARQSSGSNLNVVYVSPYTPRLTAVWLRPPIG